MIIGISGLIGSGKDTAADYLVNFHGFRRDSFASTLKDAVAAIFGWDRTLLEGRTASARAWREQIDPWWAARLNIPDLTPRLILQLWGTEVCREGFHNDIWIASLENKLRQTNDNIVISDCRFANEIAAIRNAGGRVIRIVRGPEPEWFSTARLYPEKMQHLWPNIHASEYSWAGTQFDAIIENNSSIEDLYKELKNLV
jgi:hypothetical protein